MCDYMISSRINADIFCVPIILLLLSAWNLSPVESDCRPLDNREKQLYSVVSHVIIVMIMSVYFVAMVLGLKRLELCVSCATMLTGIAQMPVYFRS